MSDTDGMTWEEWAAELFEYEVCSECAGDVADHEPLVILGHWFAHCLDSSEEGYGRRLAALAAS